MLFYYSNGLIIRQVLKILPLYYIWSAYT